LRVQIRPSTFPPMSKVGTVRGSEWVTRSSSILPDAMPDIPLAYFITFRCYGTWLHGDERGSIDRHHKQYSSPYITPNPNWHAYTLGHLKYAPVMLSELQRACVEKAIRETCRFRNWELKAINVRTNHVHALVSTRSLMPETVLNALKANATRQLRQDGYWPYGHTPWADGGSRRYVWTQLGVERALDYVVNGQGGEIPEFDEPRNRKSPTDHRGRN
jgi:REP element-mobilizing transposase RayT